MVELSSGYVNFGAFIQIKKQEQIVKLKNTGTELLVIQGVSTSCGCTKVEYDEKPISVGGEASLNIIYEADENGHFRKAVNVFCNAGSSPLQIVVTGEAIEK